jgi:hypothetical protein
MEAITTTSLVSQDTFTDPCINKYSIDWDSQLARQ